MMLVDPGSLLRPADRLIGGAKCCKVTDSGVSQGRAGEVGVDARASAAGSG